eukprot:scaffold1320_cov326-Prasinococcus_capsulatus_cf.AAC.2
MVGVGAQSAAHSEPSGQPKDPRDGAQGLLGAVGGLALGGARAHVEHADFLHDGGLVVVVVEALRGVGQLPVGLLAGHHELLHDRGVVAVLVALVQVGGGLEQPREAHRELVHGRLHVAVAVGHRLALLRELDAPLHGPRRLRHDGLVRRARAAPYGAAAAVEDARVHARAGRKLGDV